MDFKCLEQEVYEVLKEFFIVDDNDYDYQDNDGRNLCVVPPGIVFKILDTLVAPIVTALVSEFLVRKLIMQKDNRSKVIKERAKYLNKEAQKEIEHRSEKLLRKDQTSGFITQNISANLVINVSVNSLEDSEKLLGYLEKYSEMAKVVKPYGDGNERTEEVLEENM